MEPQIQTLQEKKMVGKSLRMSLINNNTTTLWRNFMLRRNEISNSVTTNLYSIQIYDYLHYFQNFNPNTEFEKWATTEVSDFDSVPSGMDSFVLPSGLYAVFIHKGAAISGEKTFQHIFNVWLPQSIYELDNRPHFEILGDKYKNNDPSSEEEIWIPIKVKRP